MLGISFGIATAQDAGETLFERWYRVERDGAPIGWMWHIEHLEGDLIATEEGYVERVLVFGQERRFETTGHVTETTGGQVIAKTLTLDGRDAPNAMRTDWKQRGLWPEDLERMPSNVLGPSGAARFVAKRLEAGADRIKIKRAATLNSLAFVDQVLYDISACTEILDDREIDGYCANWGASESRIMLDAHGYPISAEFSDGTRRFLFRATSKEEATAPFEPTEGIETSRVIVEVSSSLASSWPEWSFRVSRVDGLQMNTFSPIGTHHAKVEDGALIVSRSQSAVVSPSHEDLSTSLVETNLINFSQLDVERSPAADRGTLKRARALENLVRDRITTRSYALRLADAATAWDRREGDCTEHAVLLAAVLRRDGIPARVVGGLVRISDSDHSVVQHLWVQALVESRHAQRWEDLDATAPADADLDDRIALGATGVTDPTVEDLVSRLGSYFGLLEVIALPPE